MNIQRFEVYESIIIWIESPINRIVLILIRILEILWNCKRLINKNSIYANNNTW